MCVLTGEIFMSDNSIKINGKTIDIDTLQNLSKGAEVKNDRLNSVFGNKSDSESFRVLDDKKLIAFINDVLEKNGSNHKLSAKEIEALFKQSGITGSDKSAVQAFLKNLDDSNSKIRNIRSTTLENGEAGIIVGYEPDKNGNTTTVTYRKFDGSVVKHHVQHKDLTSNTTKYDSENTVSSRIVKKDGTLDVDSLGRLVKRVSNRKDDNENITEYTYNDDSKTKPSKIKVQLRNGTVIVFEAGKKIITKPDGKTNVEDDSTTTDPGKIISRLIKPSRDSVETGNETENIDSIAERVRRGSVRIPEKNIKESAKKAAADLKSIIYAKGDSSRLKNLKEIVYSKLNSNNIDWVLYEYKKLTKHDLFSDLEKVLSGVPNEFSKINKHLAEVQYKKYGVDLNFKDRNSVVSNAHRHGDPYSVVQNGTIMTITNKKTKQTRQINLDVLLNAYPNARERAALIKQLQQLPGEVLMDIAVETDSFVPLRDGEVVNVGNGGRCQAAGYYRPSDDTIHLSPDNPVQTLVHETGHSVDFNGRNNTSSVLRDKEFKKVFNAEMRAYLSAGNQRYIYDPSGNSSSPGNLYATANEKEMFAECYTLLMTGNCNSKDVIERYFPRTLAYINQKIDRIRNTSDGFRH